MNITKIILLAVSVIAAIFIIVSKILAQKAYAVVVENENLAKKSRLFETIGGFFVCFAIGMATRILLFN